MGVILDWVSTYPTTVDTFPTLTDGTHDVRASHLNSLATSLIQAETKQKPLFSWNGIDLSQFDTTPVVSSGQSCTLVYAASSLTKPLATMDFTATWAGSGGGVAFRVATSQDLVLPERFRVRVYFARCHASTRIGPFFFDPTTWGAPLVGYGYTVGAASNIRMVQAVGAAGTFPPFTFPSSTPVMPGTLDDDEAGVIHELEMVNRPGLQGNGPRPLGQLFSKGGEPATSTQALSVVEWTGSSPPPAAYDAKTCNSLGFVLQSVSTGTVTAKIAGIQIWASEW